MVAVIYTAKPGDPVTTRCHGFTFEHGKPTEIPDDHPFVKQGPDGLSLLDGNPYFSVSGRKKPGPKPREEIETPEAYFAYAVEWINKTVTSSAITARWANEEPMRTKVGWGSDDEDKMRPILQPKIDNMRKAEQQLSN